ncbi:CPBP family intramembrane metalloprotease [Flaviaesturariibacter flavus]|uniref:CPBP family intramembrane metalloprotease n=1 Tax=Flaviaesturariibacter flavus TaxID=2502780 RepID=A0A4R1B974_9BACT|nr:CPBP family intramembrane glutamic endopeptidase [Flaviaesturariibacter flavus]TCJ13249.1 CPBP family intramembrane metalloprotease [Flaviaesturariibacter flavus]
MPLPLSRPRNPLARAALFWTLFVILLFLQGSMIKPFFPPAYERFVYGLQGMIAAGACCYLFASRATVVTSARRQPGLAVAGFAAGLLLTALLFLVVYGTGGAGLYRTHAPFSALELLPYLALLFLAWMEEIAFRGYPFRLLEERYGLPVAQLIVAVAFAVYHMASGWHPLQALAGPGVWSFLFGIAAARSGGIALPTGLHFGVNVMQALAGGFPGYRSLWKAGIPDHPQAMQLAGLVTQAAILGLSLWLTFRCRRPLATG